MKKKYHTSALIECDCNVQVVCVSSRMSNGLRALYSGGLYGVYTRLRCVCQQVSVYRYGSILGFHTIYFVQTGSCTNVWACCQ